MVDIITKRFYEIDKRHTPYGTFKLWESKKYGDTRSCIVTLDDSIIGRTFDSLDVFIKDIKDDLEA